MRRTGVVLVVGLLVVAAGMLVAFPARQSLLLLRGYVILQYVVIASRVETSWGGTRAT